MKIITDQSRIQHNLTEASEFGIQQSDMSHVLGILRSRIYSNKVLAVLREYLTNAIDAMKEAGRDDPVQLTLPSLSDPNLTIRDYGNGLTEQEIKELYIMYGASTKRSSNDYTGCLGIGCKAAFAYTDAFTITSWNQGYKTIWSASIDEATNGKIHLLSKELSNEKEGISIAVPIQAEDISTFISEAKALLPYCSYPIECNEEWKTLNIVQQGDTWCLTKNENENGNQYSYVSPHGKAKAVMGNIPYKIEISKMGDHHALTDNLHELLQCSNLVISFPLGSLDIAANRETLEYTKHTISSICIEATKVAKDVSKTIEDAASSCTTLYEASLYIIRVTKTLPNALQNTIRDTATWQGKKIIQHLFFPNNVTRHFRKHRWKADDYANAKETLSSINLTQRGIKPDNLRICKYDADILSPANATKRIRTLQAQDNWDKEAVYLCLPITKYDKRVQGTTSLEGDDIPALFIKGEVEPQTVEIYGKPQKTKWNSNIHLFADIITDITQLDPYVSPRATVSRSKSKSVRITLCEVVPSETMPGRLNALDEPTPCQGQYIYIPLDRFSWNGKAISLERAAMESYLEANKILTMFLDGIEKPTIHGVKKHYLNKLTDEWITYDQWFLDKFKQFKNKYRKLWATSIFAAYHEHTGFPQGYDDEEAFTLIRNVDPLLNEIVTINRYEQLKYQCPNDQLRLELATEYGVDAPLPYDMQTIRDTAIRLDVYDRSDEGTNHQTELKQKALTKWPLLAYIDCPYNIQRKTYANEIKRYIKLLA